MRVVPQHFQVGLEEDQEYSWGQTFPQAEGQEAVSLS